MLKGKKTMLVNGLVVLLAVFHVTFPDANVPDPSQAGELVDQAENFIENNQDMLTDTQALWLGIYGIVNMILRAVTSTPVFKKE